MKNLISGFCVAFSLYSKIPMPRTEWTKSTMKYALSFLPLIGLLVGGLELLWLHFAQALGVTGLLYAVVATLLPVLLTGGIHMDGFVDTSDALCSYGDREKRLEILKDPHVGAFGVMYLACMLLLHVGLYAQLYVAPTPAPMLLVSFALARTIGGGAIVWLPCAKNSGLAKTFAEGSDKTPVRIALGAQLALCVLLLGALSLPLALCVLAAGAVLLPLFRLFCLRIFGGVTGDLAGFCITITETLLLALCVIGGLL